MYGSEHLTGYDQRALRARMPARKVALSLGCIKKPRAQLQVDANPRSANLARIFQGLHYFRKCGSVRISFLCHTRMKSG